MKKIAIFITIIFTAIFAPALATAADLPRNPIRTPENCPSSFSILGTSIGGSKLFGNSQASFDLITASNSSNNGSGGLLGARTAYRYNFNTGFFIGGDIDGFGGNTKNKMKCILYNSSNSLNGISNVKMLSFGSITTRLGYSYNGLEVSLVGGRAFANAGLAQHDLYLFTYGDYAPASNHVFSGWTLGASASADITSTMSIGIDYRHSDFGKYDMIAYLIPVHRIAHIHPTMNLFTVGLRYKF